MHPSEPRFKVQNAWLVSLTDWKKPGLPCIWYPHGIFLADETLDDSLTPFPQLY